MNLTSDELLVISHWICKQSVYKIKLIVIVLGMLKVNGSTIAHVLPFPQNSFLTFLDKGHVYEAILLTFHRYNTCQMSRRCYLTVGRSAAS